MKNDEFKKALNYSYKFLNIRPRTEKEIINKLNSKGYDDKIINNVVEKLKRIDYINDHEFCINWLNYRLKVKPVGKKRCVWELINKGVSRDLAFNTVDNLMSNELEEKIANDLFKKNFVKYKIKNNGIKKLKMFLYRRGFSIEIIEKISKHNNFQTKW